MATGSISTKNEILHCKSEKTSDCQYNNVPGLEAIFKDVGVGVSIKCATKPEMMDYDIDSDAELTSSTSITTTNTTVSVIPHTKVDQMNYVGETTPPEINVPYNFDWVFRNLRKPSCIWYFFSQVVIFTVGLFSKVVLVLMNKTCVHNRQRLIDAVVRRPNDVPLVTVSNHRSCFDDPGLWGVLPIQHVCNTFMIRWSLAAHDICFTNIWRSLFFMLGKCIPVVRGTGVYQEAVDMCIQKLSQNHWVHVFPEGKVNVTKEELRLKWGIGRIIYESPRVPIVLPMWHEGMDDVLPNVEPYVLKFRKKVTFNIGKPIDLKNFVEDLKKRCIPEKEARKLITDKIQDVFHDLRIETEDLHKKSL